MKCEVCGREFESKRKTARYCSAKCRKLAFQGKEVSVPEIEVSVPKGRVSVPVSVPERVSVPVVTDSTQVKDVIHILSGRKKNRDRDDFFSPDYDLSEEGFIRRNRDWRDRRMRIRRG